jgi:hypothetical protein
MGDSYVNFTGGSGQALSCPDAAALDLTGNIDLRMHLAMDDWTPAATTMLMLKGAGATVNFQWHINTTGTIAFGWVSPGFGSFTSSVAPTVSDGASLWLRVTFEPNTGSGRRAIFYTSADGSSWTQLGTTQTNATPVTLTANTGALNIGQNGANNFRLAGKIYSAEVRNGIAGTIVASPDATSLANGATSFADAQGNTWTVTSPATVVDPTPITGASRWYYGMGAA